jgi:hypothetical protein
MLVVAAVALGQLTVTQLLVLQLMVGQMAH